MSVRKAYAFLFVYLFEEGNSIINCSFAEANHRHHRRRRRRRRRNIHCYLFEEDHRSMWEKNKMAISSIRHPHLFSKHPWLVVVLEDICEWKIRSPIAVEHLPKKNTRAFFLLFFLLFLLLLLLFFLSNRVFFFPCFLAFVVVFLHLLDWKRWKHACTQNLLAKITSSLFFLSLTECDDEVYERERERERGKVTTLLLLTKRGPEILEKQFTGSVNNCFLLTRWIMYVLLTFFSFSDLPVSSTDELANSKIV